MKQRFGLAVVALALLTSVASAQFFFGCEQKLPVGPWYLYWPLEGHFQVPAVPQYPYWTAPQTLPVVPPAPYSLMNQHGAVVQPGVQQPSWPTGYGQFPGSMPGGATTPQTMLPPGATPLGQTLQPGAFQGMQGTYPTGLPYPNLPGFGQQPRR
jgi:hypothetical protein